MAIRDPSEYGLIYGSKNNVMAWHIDLKNPIVLATRNDSGENRSHVTSLAFRDGKLYDAGYGGIVRETLTNRVIGGIPKTKEESPIFGIGFLNSKLVALRHAELSKTSPKMGAELYYVENNESITNQLGGYKKDGSGYKEDRLFYRPHSLELKITKNGKIYIASENIIQVIPRENKKPKIEKLTGYLGDFAILACDENKVYSIHTHNEDSNPDGTEVREVPSNKRVAFWTPSEDWKGKENQKSYGYAKMFAAIGNTLIIGTEYLKKYSNNEFNIYSVNITPKMLRSKNGARASPQILIRNAFKDPHVYGCGNPLVVLPREDLEKILHQIHK